MSKENRYSRDNVFERRMKQVKEYSNREPDEEIVIPMEPERERTSVQSQKRAQRQSRTEYKVVVDTVNSRGLFGYEQYHELFDLSAGLTRFASDGWVVLTIRTTPVIAEGDLSRKKDNPAVGLVVVTVLLERKHRS